MLLKIFNSANLFLLILFAYRRSFIAYCGRDTVMCPLTFYSLALRKTLCHAFRSGLQEWVLAHSLWAQKWCIWVSGQLLEPLRHLCPCRSNFGG